MVYRGFKEILYREGLEKIEVLGQEFDPNLHEAILGVPISEGQEDNQVVQEMQKGYKMRNKVIRPARVTVAREIEDNLDQNHMENH
jgi:molecular chaperone GrpE